MGVEGQGAARVGEREARRRQSPRRAPASYGVRGGAGERADAGRPYGLVLFVALAPLLLAAAPAEDAEEEQPVSKSIEKVEQQVVANEDALERLRDQASSILDQLAAAEAVVRGLEQEASAAEEQARLAEVQVAKAQKEEEKAKGALIDQLHELSPRLRARYALGKQGEASVLMTARSVGNLLWRKQALERVLAVDLRLVSGAREGLKRHESKRAALEAVRAEHAAKVQAANERRSQARQRKRELTALHDALMQEQSLRERTLGELQREHAKLSKLIADLEESGGQGFAERKGRLRFPTRGVIEVGFGKVFNAKFNTVTFQKGLDLRAAKGTEVIAVAPGKVVHAGDIKGYGNLVIVDHGEGYHTLYAHLESIALSVGKQVQEAEVIGRVGDTGSLKGAYLYFELRRKGKPVDPKRWLGAP